MVCQVCNKALATSHIHSVVNGIVKDVYLCSDCAKNYKLHDFKNDSFEDMLLSLFNDAINTKSVKCDCCGLTFEEIKRSGRMGCGQCYQTFAQQLIPMVQKIHGSTRHLGKSPQDSLKIETNKNSNVTDDVNVVDHLKSKLKVAIDSEEYELAALLRDEIKRLEE